MVNFQHKKVSGEVKPKENELVLPASNMAASRFGARFTILASTVPRNHTVITNG